MKELNKYLDTFYPLIDKLITLSNNKNVRLGGSLILKLHGLKFSRAIGDLDVIITNPSEEQLKYLQDLQFFNYEDDGYIGSNFKFKKKDLFLNILVVPRFEGNIVPLYYQYNNQYYGIIDIDEIILAKKKYFRSKDIADFILLKNENFNI